MTMTEPNKKDNQNQTPKPPSNVVHLVKAQFVQLTTEQRTQALAALTEILTSEYRQQ